MFQMIKQFVISLILFSVVSAGPGTIPPGMQDTWARFQNALRQDNPDALAQVCKFPLESNEFGGTIRNASVLKARYKTIFTAKTRKCLLGQTIKREVYGKKVYFEAFCDNDKYPIRFVFEQVGSKFLFVSIDNVNE